MAGSSETYRVIGVRADDSRHVLSKKLSLEDASYLRDVLLSANIFRAVLIELNQSTQFDEDEETG
ncbi:MAG TPA: hypothetical protein VKU82_05260 [Planctomycetaceae bacterium]|nr:hypothetical protein [Planctomycetaceae bacterium]